MDVQELAGMLARLRGCCDCGLICVGVPAAEAYMFTVERRAPATAQMLPAGLSRGAGFGEAG